MTNKELQAFLADYPDNWPVKWLIQTKQFDGDFVDFDPEDRISITSETAYLDKDAPEDEWDCEDGKIELGDGQRIILFNPILV